MKTPLFHPFFIAALLMAVANQLLERSGIYIPFIHSYLDDFLCFPIMLSTGLASYRLAVPTYQLGGWHIWPLFCVVVFVFEIYLPATSPRYTADVIDIVFYLLGILAFQKTMNREPKSANAFATN